MFDLNINVGQLIIKSLQSCQSNIWLIYVRKQKESSFKSFGINKHPQDRNQFIQLYPKG